MQDSSLLAPAESSNISKDRVIGNLSDNHNIWHMFSATGLFFTFLVLITLDGGLFPIPRDRIPIV